MDLLLSSAAEVFGESLVAVILSGTGSDGAGGARAVKEAGGTVVIQNPETAEFGGMPGALAPNTVDIVVELERIGPILEELISKIEQPEEEDEEEVSKDEHRSLRNFLEQLRERHGVEFTSYKMPTISRRLKRRMVATGTQSIAEYSAFLEGNPQEYRQLINTFLIKVTEFFRDPDLFAYLKEEVFPDLLETARREGRQVRVWSAGCATGEEAYTLAMLISELLGSEAALSDVRIFATDADEEAVDFARHGIGFGALSRAREARDQAAARRTHAPDESVMNQLPAGVVLVDPQRRAPGDHRGAQHHQRRPPGPQHGTSGVRAQPRGRAPVGRGIQAPPIGDPARHGRPRAGRQPRWECPLEQRPVYTDVRGRARAREM